MRRHRATDPLDYIHGLLGVAADSADFPTPDYTRSVAELYTQVTRTWVQRDNNMSFLANCSIQGAFEISGLPSWVPNWAGFRKTLFPVPYKHYRATGETEASLKICDEMPQCLQVFGLPQATIAYVELFDIFEAFENEVKAAPIVLQTWTSDNFEDIHSNTPRLQQYFRTLMFDWDPVTDARLSPSNSSFFDLLSGCIMFWWSVSNKFEISSDLSRLLDISICSASWGGGGWLSSFVANSYGYVPRADAK
jgi:hypothetical protein